MVCVAAHAVSKGISRESGRTCRLLVMGKSLDRAVFLLYDIYYTPVGYQGNCLYDVCFAQNRAKF